MTFLDTPSLRTGFPDTGWRELVVVDSTGSTNADVAAAARVGAAAGLVEVTGWQRSGKGRLGRVWETPPQTCLAMSVLVRPQASVASWGWLSIAVGLAVREGLREATGLDVTLKWPNDVLLEGRKVCGILSEAVDTSTGRAAVLGMGINVALTADQLPVPTATSLHLAGSDVGADAVALAVLRALHRWYGRFDAGHSLVADYRAACDTIGKDVQVSVPGGIVHGQAVGVDADGSLIVRSAGRDQAYAAGDVVHVRPAGASS